MADLLFDPELLESLDLTEVELLFNPRISLLRPGPNLRVRPLSVHDYEAGYVDLLKQLTDTGDTDVDKFAEPPVGTRDKVAGEDYLFSKTSHIYLQFRRTAQAARLHRILERPPAQSFVFLAIPETFKSMKCKNGTYFITVIEDEDSKKVIGSATLLIEQKFIHSCAQRGRIEDVVVNSEYRGKQLGKVLLRLLTVLAQRLGCYKLTLDCRDSNRPFYENLGFKKEETNSNFMQKRFDQD